MKSIDLALLLLRLSLSYVLLYAAWKNTENKAAWTWTLNETGLLFKRFSPQWQQRLTLFSAIAGMVMMYGGGSSILLGIEPRLGGIAIAVFCLLGTKIHAIRRDEAKQAGEGGNAMGWSAYSAHIAAGLKNWALAGEGAAIFLAGAGKFGLGIDYLGSLLGLME